MICALSGFRVWIMSTLIAATFCYYVSANTINIFILCSHVLWIPLPVQAEFSFRLCMDRLEHICILQLVVGMQNLMHVL